MAAHSKIRELEEQEAGDDRVLASEVRAVLVQILESQPFRTSKQCKDLLQYIVERSLTGDESALRERVIGTAVFGRKPAYNTDEDPVVRTRAADVRKRLAQHYQALEPGSQVVHIELKPGSYRAHFRVDRPNTAVPSGDQPVPASFSLENQLQETRHPRASLRSFSSRRRLIALLCVLGMLAGVSAWIMPSFWSSPQERFWAPLTTARQPILVYLGSNAAYVLSPDFLERYRAAHGLPNTGPEFFVDLPPGSTIKAEDMVPVKDTFVTSADAAASVQLTTLLRGWKRPFLLRAGSDLSIGDLRNRPTLMIGAFNNPWTIEITKDLPFRFQEGTRIQDRDHTGRSWSVAPRSNSSATDDYALISRVLVSKTGGPSITVAGISEYGTRAAAEFLANPDEMRDLLKTAPRGWEHKNVQIVLHVKVLDYQPIAAQVVATAYW